MNSTLSKGVPLDFDRTTLFIGFFGCYCAFNRSMLGVDRCCWSISGWAVGAIAGGASGSIGRFVLTILLMAWTIVILQHFLNSWLGGEWLGFMGWGCFFCFGWDVAESAVFVGDIGFGAEVVNVREFGFEEEVDRSNTQSCKGKVQKCCDKVLTECKKEIRTN
jgi:hypothetical protein